MRALNIHYGFGHTVCSNSGLFRGHTLGNEKMRNKGSRNKTMKRSIKQNMIFTVISNKGEIVIYVISNLDSLVCKSLEISVLH